MNWEEKATKDKFLKKLSGDEITKIKEMLWLDFIEAYPQWLEIDTLIYLDAINGKDEGETIK